MLLLIFRYHWPLQKKKRKRLFVILQFGRIQIFSLGHSLEQTACYCWRALATVPSSPTEATEAILALRGKVEGGSENRRCMKRSEGRFPAAKRSRHANKFAHLSTVFSMVCCKSSYSQVSDCNARKANKQHLVWAVFRLTHEQLKRGPVT